MWTLRGMVHTGGGLYFSGPSVCIAGYTCTYENPYYSQCLPSQAPTTTSTCAAPTVNPTCTVTHTIPTTTITITTSLTGPATGCCGSGTIGTATGITYTTKTDTFTRTVTVAPWYNNERVYFWRYCIFDQAIISASLRAFDCYFRTSSGRLTDHRDRRFDRVDYRKPWCIGFACYLALKFLRARKSCRIFSVKEIFDFILCKANPPAEFSRPDRDKCACGTPRQKNNFIKIHRDNVHNSPNSC